MFVQESELRIILHRTIRLSYVRRDIQPAVGILIGGGVQNIGKHNISKSMCVEWNIVDNSRKTLSISFFFKTASLIIPSFHDYMI